MHVAEYVGLAHQSETKLAEALSLVAQHHKDEVDVEQTCELLASWSRANVDALAPLSAKYREEAEGEPEELFEEMFHGPRRGAVALIRDLQDLWLLASQVKLCWTVLDQAAKALRDEELEQVCADGMKQTQRQINWLQMRIKQAAPQSLVIAK